MKYTKLNKSELKIKNKSKASIISKSDLFFQKQFQEKGFRYKKPYPNFLEMHLGTNSEINQQQNYNRGSRINSEIIIEYKDTSHT